MVRELADINEGRMIYYKGIIELHISIHTLKYPNLSCCTLFHLIGNGQQKFSHIISMIYHVFVLQLLVEKSEREKENVSSNIFM
jgi:hypothetical protein